MYHSFRVDYFFMNFFFVNQSLEGLLESKRIMNSWPCDFNEPMFERKRIQQFIENATQSYSGNFKTEIKTILYAAFTFTNVGLYNGQGDDTNTDASFASFTFYLDQLIQLVPPFASHDSNHCQQILYYAAVLLENHHVNKYLRSGNPGLMTRDRMILVESICNSS